MDIARRISILSFAVLASASVGCAVGEDPGKQSAAAHGDNAQPGDLREAPTDDPGEESESPPTQPPDQTPPPDTCTAAPIASIDGWTPHENGHFAFQTPSTWTAVTESPGYVEVTKKLAVGAGWRVYVRETAVAGTQADGAGTIGDYPESVVTSGVECVVQSGGGDGTWACAPMVNEQLICKGANTGTMHVWWRFVYSGGHTFEMWCNASNTSDPDTDCPKVMDTLEIHM